MPLALCSCRVLSVCGAAFSLYADADHSSWLLESNAVDVAFPFLLCLSCYFTHDFQLDFMGEYRRKSLVNSY